MSLSSLKAKRALGRRGRELPRLHDAVNAREVGYEAARLVASMASRETVEPWVERPRERTVKHLREEIDAAQMLGRVGVDTTMAPPTVTTMDAIAALEQRIVTCEPLQSGESHLFAGPDSDHLGHARLISRRSAQRTAGNSAVARWVSRPAAGIRASSQPLLVQMSTLFMGHSSRVERRSERQSAHHELMPHPLCSTCPVSERH